MTKRDVDPTGRFSSRVENYVRYRPGYPAEVLRVLAEQTGFSPRAVVADIGSGTGISTRLFLEHGNTVYAVEPNDAMRAAAEVLSRDEPRFHSVNGTAEQTTLADHSIDYVVAGQAFHWFDVDRARHEFLRVLRPGGWVVLMWNTRLTDTTPFLRGYEKLLLEFGTDYQEVNHANVSPETLKRFFGATPSYRAIPNEQVFDLAGLTGRLLSSSYVPAEDDPRHAPMLAALAKLFAAHEEAGRVRFEYDTELYFGQLV
ncbi:MAG TPA: class I SAM-dependent methyltransferase [Pirellulales bacterium]|nr:class I SAM-dependent methyltransferase [Pirellulales bacterium]